MRPCIVAAVTLVTCAGNVRAQGSDVATIDMHLHAERGTSAQDWQGVLDGLALLDVVHAMLSVDDVDGPGWEHDAPRFLFGVSFPCYDGLYPAMDPCFAETDGWPDVAWLRRQHAAGRLHFLGELLYVYYGIPPTDERLEPYWALAEELDIPVGVHIGRGPRRRAPGCCPHFNDDLGNPALLLPVLERHPNLRIWLMHAGGRDFFPETIALMKAYPNVYAEMSIVNSIAPAVAHAAGLRRFLDEGLLDRIMFGSDNMPAGDIWQRIDAVEFLTAEQRAGIYCYNAARFLRLDQNVCEMGPH